MPDGGCMDHCFNPAEQSRAFRDALGRFATGVTVVTTAGPEGPLGFTANSFSAVSLDPPLVLWSPARSSSRFAAFAQAAHYSIHVLGADQRDLCERFARSDGGFEGLSHGLSAEGAPLLRGALARFDCARHAGYDGGDHMIIVGRVLRANFRDGAPLIFSQGGFKSV